MVSVLPRVLNRLSKKITKIHPPNRTDSPHKSNPPHRILRVRRKIRLIMPMRRTNCPAKRIRRRSRPQPVRQNHRLRRVHFNHLQAEASAAKTYTYLEVLATRLRGFKSASPHHFRELTKPLSRSSRASTNSQLNGICCSDGSKTAVTVLSTLGAQIVSGTRLTSIPDSGISFQLFRKPESTREFRPKNGLGDCAQLVGHIPVESATLPPFLHRPSGCSRQNWRSFEPT
jgi:hypothetical protein